MTRTSILSGVKQDKIIYFMGGTTPSTINADYYLSLIAPSSTNSSESYVTLRAISKGVLRHFRVLVTTAPGGVTTWTCTVRKNGANTALTCVITGVETSAEDLIHEVAVAKGDLLCVFADAGGAVASTTIKLNLEYYLN